MFFGDNQAKEDLRLAAVFFLFSFFFFWGGAHFFLLGKTLETLWEKRGFVWKKWDFLPYKKLLSSETLPAFEKL